MEAQTYDFSQIAEMHQPSCFPELMFVPLAGFLHAPMIGKSGLKLGPRWLCELSLSHMRSGKSPWGPAKGANERTDRQARQGKMLLYYRSLHVAKAKQTDRARLVKYVLIHCESKTARNYNPFLPLLRTGTAAVLNAKKKNTTQIVSKRRVHA